MKTLEQKRMIRTIKERGAAITEGRAYHHDDLAGELEHLQSALTRTGKESPREVLRGLYGSVTVIFK